MFDTTMTEIDVTGIDSGADGEWRREAGIVEPDLAVDGLGPSLVSRLLSVLGVSVD